MDGVPHNVALLNSDGNVIEKTENMSEKGEKQTLKFTVTKEMAEYVCEVHPTSMRGDISFGEAKNQTGGSSEPYFETGPSVRLEKVAEEGLTAPLDFEVLPGESDRFFVVDQVGQIYTFDRDSGERTLFIDLSDQTTDYDDLPEKKVIDERGLLGLTFHPNFAENRKFYVTYSAPRRDGTPSNYTHTQVVSEIKANEDGTKALPDTERALLEMPSPYYTHNGGALDFGPEDGYLYISIGNGGGSLDSPKQVDDWYATNPGGNGQDVGDNLLGSILRIDVDSQEDDKPYGIPDDNPLVDGGGLSEHWAWGFRNPWRIGFSGGRLMAADVGQASYEEVDEIEKGGNYGWNVKEGSHPWTPGGNPDSVPDSTPDSVRGGEPLIDPVVDYPHPNVEDNAGAGISVIGGYFAENDAIPDLTDKYVFGDYSKGGIIPSGSLFAATPSDEGQWETKEIEVSNMEKNQMSGYLLCVGQDNEGNLYALTTQNLGPTGETGAVYQLHPTQDNSEAETAATTNSTTETNTTTTQQTNAPSQETTTGSQTTTTTQPESSTSSQTTSGVTSTGTGSSTMQTGRTSSSSMTSGTSLPEETEGTTSLLSTALSGGSSNTSESNSSGSESGTDANGPGFGILASLTALGAAGLKYLRDD